MSFDWNCLRHCRAGAIYVLVSPCLFIECLQISLMGYCKRISEIADIRVQACLRTSQTLIEYTPHFYATYYNLFGIAIVSFLAYCFEESTVDRFGTTY
jgi:hypothetical protein